MRLVVIPRSNESLRSEDPTRDHYSTVPMDAEGHDLQEAGFRHFVSRAYVHHAGSQTVGMDYQKCHEEPREWIKAHRPDMYEAIYGNT